MIKPLDRDVIALEVLPTIADKHPTEDAAAIAFQVADDFLAIAKEKAKAPEIRIILDDILWAIDGVTHDEIALSRWNEEDQGYEYNFLKMETFFNACGQAFRGVDDAK